MLPEPLAEVKRFELLRRFEPTYRISRCLGNHSDKIRRKFLSNSRSRVHSHTLLLIHLIGNLRMC